MVGVKKPAKVVEDVQNQTTKKISHFLSRVPPLCGENTESKRKQTCKYMKISFCVYIHICIYIYLDCTSDIQPCDTYNETVAGRRVECTTVPYIYYFF